MTNEIWTLNSCAKRSNEVSISFFSQMLNAKC